MGFTAVGVDDIGTRLSAKLQGFDVEIFGQSLSDAGFVIIQIQNQRAVRVGRITLEIQATVRPVAPFQIAGFEFAPTSITWASEHAGLEDGKPVHVNTLDVCKIPSGFEVELLIKGLRYTPADSHQIIREYGGDATYRVRGIASPRPAMPEAQSTGEGNQQ
jgi:hypothetical protein